LTAFVPALGDVAADRFDGKGSDVAAPGVFVAGRRESTEAVDDGSPHPSTLVKQSKARKTNRKVQTGDAFTGAI
jgi:hypothetical protein